MTPTKLPYRPEIDGLRAIAVLAVILYHADVALVAGGYIGVDVFFVISGYLITRSIYDQLLADNFSLVDFYERRIRRILPMLFFVLICSLPIAWVSLYQSDMIDYLESVICASVFGSNVLFAIEADYFEPSIEMKPLLHTWSLAVEEQFYLCYPLFLMILIRLSRRRRWTLSVLALLVLVSFGIAVWSSQHYPKHNFYLITGRLWELVAGGLLAVGGSQAHQRIPLLDPSSRWRTGLALMGIVLVIGSSLWLKVDLPHPSWPTLIPVGGTLLIIAFAQANNMAGRILSSRMLVVVGLMSYSAYMIHHPLFAFGKHLGYVGEDTPIAIKSVMIAACLAMSWVTWRYIEQPFTNRQWLHRRTIFVGALLITLTFIFIGWIGLRADGFPHRQVNAQLNIEQYTPDNISLGRASVVPLKRDKAARVDGRWFHEKNKKPNTLILGNSHAKDLYNVLMHSQSAQERLHIGQEQLQIAALSDGEHPLFDSHDYGMADIVIIASRYGEEDIDALPQLVERMLLDEKSVVIVREIHNFYTVHRKTTADLVVQDFARRRTDSPSAMQTLVDHIDRLYYHDVISTSSDMKASSDEVIDLIKSAHPSIIILDRMDYVCDQGQERCYAINAQLEKYFYDYGHHTLAGAAFFGNRVDEVRWLDPLGIDMY